MFFGTPPIRETSRGRLAGQRGPGLAPGSPDQQLPSPGSCVPICSFEPSAPLSASGRLTMKSFRRFLSTYSPMFALGAVIVGLYVMAACIGLSLNIHL